VTVELKVQGSEAITEKGRFAPRWLPGLLGSLLFLLNNLGVIHGMIAPPPGYVPLGVQRNSDIAQYLTWIRGLEKAWVLPNYHAPWITSPGLVVPGLIPAAILARLFSLSAVVALQLFTLAGYILTAYALLFAYNTFCRTRRQALWALLIAFSCVPIASLPGLFRLFRNHGVFGTSGGLIEFLMTSEGFLHGLLTWPLLTYGTCAQLLSIALLARYCNTHARRWLGWLATVCLFSALIHPFEIFVTITVVAVVLLQEDGSLAKNLADLSVVLIATAVGFAPLLFQSFRVPWLHQIETANRHAVAPILPAWLLAMLGLPAILAVILLLFGLPKTTERNAIVLKTWFVSTLLVFYIPGMPFALHLLDGVFFAVGLLLTIQIEELLAQHSFLAQPALRFLIVPILIWTLVPHVTFRLRSWRDGVSPQSIALPAGLAPVDEFPTIDWLRKNASPNDLVLATQDAAPWMATAPIHSFASHWLFSSQEERPSDEILRSAFFDGTLPSAKAHEFLETLGVRFIVVPDGSQAKLYLDQAMLRVHFTSTAIYERPGAQMKTYGDSGIVQMSAAP
jgi:hypothetical protein